MQLSPYEYIRRMHGLRIDWAACAVVPGGPLQTHQGGTRRRVGGWRVGDGAATTVAAVGNAATKLTRARRYGSVLCPHIRLLGVGPQHTTYMPWERIAPAHPGGPGSYPG
jgi:hypothetical protein